MRGTEGIKEATYNVAGMDVKVAVVSGLANANDPAGKGAQAAKPTTSSSRSCAAPAAVSTAAASPFSPASVRNFTDLKALRAKALYDQDKAMPLRKSHENPIVKKCYEEYLGEPGGHKAHEILHTSYVARKRF